MASQKSLRDFRKNKEKGQVSMLRFIRQSFTPKKIVSGSSPDCTQDTEINSNTVESTPEKDETPSSPILKTQIPKNNFLDNSGLIKVVKKPSALISFRSSSIQNIIVNGSTSSSPNKLDNNAPLPQSSKLFYVKPLTENELHEEQSKADPKESGFDISAVLKEKSHSIHNGTIPEDLDDNSQSSLDDSIIIRTYSSKRMRMESDDDSNESAPSKKPCLSNEQNSVEEIKLEDSEEETSSSSKFASKSNKFSPDMIEKLLDTYGELYPMIDKMELFDIMEKWDYDFAEMTKSLDSFVKSRKSAMNLSNKTEKHKRIAKTREEVENHKKALKEAKNEERTRQKELRAAEMERKKSIWKMKAKFHQEDEEEEEDEYIGKTKVYESDSSEGGEEFDEDFTPTAPQQMVVNFFNTAVLNELTSVPKCSKKKAEVILECRPFENWQDLVHKFKSERHVSTDLLNSAKDVLYMRSAVQNLMRRCEKLSAVIKSNVSDLIDGDDNAIRMRKQPNILNPELTLKSYQIIGLNWLILMHEESLNGVLADEMGLGKTIQSIAFLGYLKETGELDGHMCLIVVPSSTLDNWARELKRWCPSLGFLAYHGSQEERRGMRMEIINDELEEHVDIILTTYNMVTSSAEDKGLFKRLSLHTVIFDEAHMLKNMTSQRYENLMKIKCMRRVLLTGTPLQNNLVELMSILIFVMPQLFEGKKDELKKVFSMFPRAEGEESRGQYERERIMQAKRIMGPFFLRRLKKDVLQDLPAKEEEVCKVLMCTRQQKIYKKTVEVLSQRAQEMQEELEKMKLQDLDELGDLTPNNSTKSPTKKSQVVEDSTSNMLMKLRKIANHPLLIRSLYTETKIKEMSKILKKTTHVESRLDYMIEDFLYMSDFEIHQTCIAFEPIKEHRLSDELIVSSGKFQKLDEMLPVMKKNGDRVLIFSQFVIVLNLLEEYLKIRGYTYRRLDGSTVVTDRQEYIDDFNENDDIFIFMLSTRAGGLGINLSSANKVIIHDIDFNPYNDKQAEDRCHRVGQTRNVTVYRFLSENSIEEGMYQIACNKLQLEKDVTGNEEHQKVDVLTLLKTALGIVKE